MSDRRDLELWHIPKRGSVHQTIYMVHLLSSDRFNNKSWSHGKQEQIGTEMGKAGVTRDGTSITNQSVRTLLANIPKYLGFIFIDDTTTPKRIIVTEVGKMLVEFHDILSISIQNNLNEYSLKGTLIETSDIFRLQLFKLIITNPIILEDCINILLFPFRMTMRALIDLDYLDMEEIGYILFNTKSEDQYDVMIQRIRNLRNLNKENRKTEIEAYKKTKEGSLTLVKAPTSIYYINLCLSSGLCRKIETKSNADKKITAIELIDTKKAINEIKKYEDVKIYDFKNDKKLWINYFSNPNRIETPIDYEFKTNTINDVLFLISENDEILGSDIINNNKSYLYPVFSGEEYDIKCYDSITGMMIYNKKEIFEKQENLYEIKIAGGIKQKNIDDKELIAKIQEMFDNKYKGFDLDYYNKLKIIKTLLKEDYLDNRRKGGRLEYLFFLLLSSLKTQGKIDDVYWYGKNGKYGINEPAPGGRMGNPDVIFSILDYTFILELTTIRGVRAQWNSAEASSVPDHIASFKRNNPVKKVVGIFIAPSIHHQLEQNLKLNAKQNNVAILLKKCVEFATFLCNQDRDTILQTLIHEAELQLN